ncbi:hypothetical protein AAU61_19920 [Desulfocarbo indianensis]|nr:hypothetical protein AAU61_19920 [Desulfocarbo indianensis]
MRHLVKLLALALVLCLGMFLAGCKAEEGPAEKAGKKVDQAMEKAADETGKAVEKAGEAVEKAGEAIKQEGEKAQ